MVASLCLFSQHPEAEWIWDRSWLDNCAACLFVINSSKICPRIYSFWSHVCPPTEKTNVSLCEWVKCFPSTLRWRNLKTTATVIGHSGFVFEVNSGRNISWIILTLSVLKSSMFKMFSFQKIKGQRFQTPPVWRAFSKSCVFVSD